MAFASILFWIAIQGFAFDLPKQFLKYMLLAREIVYAPPKSARLLLSYSAELLRPKAQANPFADWRIPPPLAQEVSLLTK